MAYGHLGAAPRSIKRYEEQPLQLISFQRRNDFDESLEVTLDSKVLEAVVESCEGRKICVIAVTGQARSGKGFLLNCIKERLESLENGDSKENKNWLSQAKSVDGFPINHGYKPETKGIWIWSRAFLVEGEDEDDDEIAVILLETQGIQDGITKSDEISAILGISMLTSSVVVLNVTGDLSNDVFDHLKGVVKWGNFFTKKGTPKQFQKLSFLVRDWTQISDYSYGGRSGKKLLTKRLKESGNVGGNLEQVLEEEMECFLMPHIGGQALMQTFTGNPEEINENFSKRMVTYLNGLIDPENLPAKKIFANQLSPDGWRRYITAYVDLFNDKSELEWGPPLESIWRVTQETTGNLKIDQGIKIYGEMFQQKMGNAVGGYLRDTSIEGCYVQAKRKAFEAFSELELPKEKEKYFQRQLDQLLEKEKEKLKEKCGKLRTTFVTHKLGNAGNLLRNELEAKFSFKPEMDCDPETVFYDNEDFYGGVQRIVDIVEEDFFNEFFDDDEDEVRKLKGLLNALVAPVVEKYTDRNVRNQKKAISLALEVTDNLKQKYLFEMKEVLNNVPNIEAKGLEFFHKKEIKSLTEQLEKLKIGPGHFQQQWKLKLSENIEDELEKLELSLDSTNNKAMEMVKVEENKYREDLTGRAPEIDEEEELKEYHNKACDAILKRFALINPLGKDAIKKGQIERKLKGLLDQAYVEIVEDGVVAKRVLNQTLTETVDAAIEFYKMELNKKIDEEGDFIMEDEEWTRIDSDIRDKAVERFEKNLNGILGEDNLGEVYDEEMRKMEEQLMATSVEEMAENKRKRDFAESQINDLVLRLEQDFERKMQAAAVTLKSRDDLVKTLDQFQGEMMEEFKKSCGIKNQLLKDKYIDKLGEKANKVFATLEEFFEIKKQTESVGMSRALLDAKRFYVDKMEGHFRNKRGHFSEEELLKLHTDIKKLTLEHVEIALTLEQLAEVKGHLNKWYQGYREKNEFIWRSFQEEESALGIDLGTTYCCVAVYYRGEVKILQNKLGDNTTPSYVAIQKEEDIEPVCGKHAKDLAYRNPESTIYDAKRIIGRRIDDEKLQEDMKFWPFTVIEEEGIPKIEVNGVSYFPEQISAKLLEHLREEAEEKLGFPVNKAVITVPAYFTNGQKEATLAAGEIAGFKVLGILNEPTAAAIAYRMDWFYGEDAKRILVFDLGGGTFDVAVLEMSEDRIEILAIAGNDHLGGQDFDKNMMQYCAEMFKQKSGFDLLANKELPGVKGSLRRLQATCEEGKKQLTTARTTTISIAAFHQGQDMVVEVSKSEFEKQNDKLFQETMSLVDVALKKAKLSKKDIHEVVLVGGSTRIPRLQKMLTSHFNGNALNKNINPDEAVAYGAAIQAAILSAKPGAKLFDFNKVQEVTPMSLGIEVASKEFSIIIEQGTKIPVEVTQKYQTVRNFQTNTYIKIFQGEEAIAVQNKLLGQFILDGIPPAMAGKEAVDVTMTIDGNGILSVEAICESTKGRKSITISEEGRGRMSEEEKQLLIEQTKKKEKRTGFKSALKDALKMFAE